METTKKQGVLADMSLLIVAVIWGSGFIVTKNALDAFPVYWMLALRFSIAAMVLLIIYPKKVIAIDRDTLKAGSIIGVCLFLAFLTQTIGIQWISAGKSAFLTATNVVIVPFLYFLVNRKSPDKFAIIACVMTIFGIMFLTLENGYQMEYGDFMTLLCAIGFAAHITSVGHFSGTHDPITLVIIQMFASAVFSLVLALILEPYPIGVGVNDYMSLLYLGLFSTLICFFIQNIAQKYTTSSHAALILSLESVFGVFFSVWLAGEVMTEKMMLGCGIIFIALVIAETKLEFLGIGKKRTKQVRRN